MNPKVDEYFDRLEQWQPELAQLRSMLLGCGLMEELKWGSPCYTFRNSNVAIIGGLNDYCVLSFFKGVLLHDTDGLLVKPGEHTQSARVIPFTAVREITEKEAVLKAYIYEAIEVEKAGLKVDFSEQPEFPEELTQQLAKNAALKKAFEALTPGRQKAYVLYFAAAKQSKTREARIAKYTARILDGKGLNDY